MRSPIATLQELTIPMGAQGTPHIRIGPNLPTPLKSVPEADLTAAVIWYFNADEFFFIAVGTWVTQSSRLVLIGQFDNAAGLTVWQRYATGSTVPGAAFGSTVFDSNHPMISFNDIDVTLGVESMLTLAGGIDIIDGPLTIGGIAAPLGTPTSYTPALSAVGTNPTLGTGSAQVGRYLIDPITGMVDAYIRILFGTSGVSAGSGTYIVDLPTAVTSQMSGSTGLTYPLGLGLVRDSSTGSRPTVLAQLNSFSGGAGGVGQAVLTLTDGTTVSDANPFVWAASDGIALNLRYLKA